jgi:hypothetical protein
MPPPLLVIPWSCSWKITAPDFDDIAEDSTSPVIIGSLL